MFSAFNNSNTTALKQAQSQQQQPPQQQCRPSCDSMDVDDRGSLMSKIARTGDSSTLFMSSSSGSQPEHAETTLRMLQMGSACAGTGPTALGSLGSLVRSNSILSDGRLNCSPTDSNASDSAALLAPIHENVSSALLMSADHLRMGVRPESVAAMYDNMSVRSAYHHPHSAYSSLQAHPAALPLGMSGNSGAMQGLTEQEVVMSMLQAGRMGRAFTPGQLRELQHQALVLKYIINGVNVPQDLVTPIRASLSGLSPATAHLANLPWGGYRLGFGANADPEPGRCRRTDGKKWRCSRDVVPDQKYCERHIHRGRHRARKPTDNQQAQTGTSPGVSAVSASSGASVASSVTLAATRAPAGILSTVSPVTQQPPQQLSSSLGIRQYSNTNSPSASGLSVGSSLTASQYNQLSSLHSSAGTAALSSKDYRYMTGMSRSDLDLCAEQMLFAEASGSSRGIGGQDFQSMNQQGLTMLSSINNSWRTASMQQSRAPSPSPSQQPLKSSSPSMMQYSSPQIRTLLGQDFSPLSAEANSVSLQSIAQHNQHHQHSFLGGGFGSAEAVSNVGREPESQPLRHFFDDWPRSKDASTLSWSDVEDEKPHRNSSTTQLSISIPVSSSDFNTTSSPPGKLKLSPLKLSMSRAGEDDIPLGVELGVGMGLGINEDRHRQQQANWIPIAWETPVGGPLAEVLQSSTPRAGKSSGLNLMTEGWEESPRDSPQIGSSPKEREVGSHSSVPGAMEASSKGVE
ncbi:hypothetical protein GOP47_0014888 [Adiantum capillus-veneris]|uniref:Growth-regulating factor n=1 Tax=Adiantum capillus-veneris TaxID=13818 RepID=A0A9D4UMB9_ADICA|nr:hypothetical protein GOP47_0014888 [Adiantum capillus-veneris]